MDYSLVYIAGLFDGEGDCQIQPYRATKNGKKYLRVVVRITNTDRRCLDFVKENFGSGWVGLNSRKETHIVHKAKKDCYKFHLTNKKAVNLLKAIRPFLIIKAEKVDRLLSERHNGRAPQPIFGG